MGIYARGNKLWIRYKGPDGKWTQRTTPFRLGQETKAKRLLQRVEEKIAAGEEILEEDGGRVTVRRYASKWIERREAQGIIEWRNDKTRIERRILPVIGDMSLDEVRPRHIVSLIEALRRETDLSPKSIYNVYSNLKALFRDAMLDDLVDATPCILTKHQLGPNEDKNSEWRATAIYSRDEAELLISDARIPEDRHVLYTLEVIGMLRHGEAAGLRFRHYDDTMKPLGRLVIATSYDKGRTKTGRTRYMPVHPTLAAILADWKARGWREMMGRAPEPDDLIVPLPESRRVVRGAMRSKNHSFKRLDTDLRHLGLRHRRGHDLRRTGISLARTDGARRDILELCTHNPGKGHSTIDVYTTFPWASLCEEVAKLRIRWLGWEAPEAPSPACDDALGAGQVGEPVSTDGKLATVLATSSSNNEQNQAVKVWRRRESKNRPGKSKR